VHTIVPLFVKEEWSHFGAPGLTLNLRISEHHVSHGANILGVATLSSGLPIRPALQAAYF